MFSTSHSPRERVVDAGTRRADKAAVHQLRRTRHPDQPAPGARSDQFADAGPLEVPGHGVTAGAGALVDDHHLRAEDALRLHQLGSRRDWPPR